MGCGNSSLKKSTKKKKKVGLKKDDQVVQRSIERPRGGVVVIRQTPKNFKFWYLVFDYLTLRELLKASCVCHAFNYHAGNRQILRKFQRSSQNPNPKNVYNITLNNNYFYYNQSVDGTGGTDSPGTFASIRDYSGEEGGSGENSDKERVSNGESISKRINHKKLPSLTKIDESGDELVVHQRQTGFSSVEAVANKLGSKLSTPNAGTQLRPEYQLFFLSGSRLPQEFTPKFVSPTAGSTKNAGAKTFKFSSKASSDLLATEDDEYEGGGINEPYVADRSGLSDQLQHYTTGSINISTELRASRIQEEDDEEGAISNRLECEEELSGIVA